MFARTCWISMALAVCSSSLGAGEFPYTGYVNGDNVYVRSGPGEQYYPTGKLHRGGAVEVYRHDPGGWYAVRPPQASFSWISGRYVEVDDDGIGVVSGNRVVVRVGSGFSDIRDVIQVQLNRGEEVAILDKKTFGTGPGAQVWYKIAPPAGEFRWIHGKYIDTEPLPERVAQPSSRENLLLRKMERDETQKAVPPRPDADAEPLARGWQQSKGNRLASYDEVSNNADPRRYPEGRSPEELRASLPAATTARGQEDKLDQLSAELALIVSEEPTVWNFDSLRTEAQAILADAQTALLRGRARQLLAQIERWESIRSGYREIEKTFQRTDRLNAHLEPEASPPAETSEFGPVAEPTTEPISALADRYDEVGRLTPVHSQRFGAPPYALVDRNGNVKSYVTPAPGVGMRRYIGRQVGVVGSVGVVPELKKQHVIAKRITSLEGAGLRR